MIDRFSVACVAVATLGAVVSAQAGVLTINNIGRIYDGEVLGAVDTAISNVTSLYNTGNGAGDVTLNIDFRFDDGPSPGELAYSYQSYYSYSYNDYTNALAEDSDANPHNKNLATAVDHLADGNAGPMAITYGQALLLSQYGLGNPAFLFNDVIDMNSNVTWNFNGTAASTEYDAIGVFEHELDELLGIGDGGSRAAGCSGSYCRYGSTDLYRYSGPGVPSTSISSTYLSIDGGVSSVVAFNDNIYGGLGDFGPPCGPAPNQQYVQDAFTCPGMHETYDTSSPEYVAATAVGWDPVSVPEPPSDLLFFIGLVGLIRLCSRPSEVVPTRPS